MYGKGRGKRPPVEVVSLAKERPKNKPLPKKVCSECGREQPFQSFYSNRMLATGVYRDRWCKSCIAEKCYNEKTLRNYFFKNNRAWSVDLWNEAMREAAKRLAVTVEFSKLETEEERQEAIEKQAVQVALSLMNKQIYYKYVNNDNADLDVDANFDAEKSVDYSSEDPYYSLQIYSEEWRGNYTQFEIDSMNKYLESIVTTRGIEDDVALGYAKDFVKQSALVARLAQIAKDNPTKENIELHQKAYSTLSSISAAGNIAPAHKKNDQTVGLGAFGLLIKMLENGDKLGKCPEFPPDQIDAIIKDFRHLATAIDSSGALWKDANESYSDIDDE